MKLLLLMALASILALACAPGPEPETVQPAAPEKSKPLTYLALGDSYTIGEAVTPEERWPVQLVRTLRENGIDMEDPVIIARTGWTTGELKDAIAASDTKGPFDLVSLLIGVNNQYRGMDITIFVQEFKELLDTAIGFAGGNPDRVFVVSIPDWGVTPFAEGRDREQIASEIDAYNRVLQAACNATGVRYVEITDISRMVPEMDGLVAPDGLHPSGAMYAAFVQRIAPGVTAMLEEDSSDGR